MLKVVINSYLIHAIASKVLRNSVNVFLFPGDQVEKLVEHSTAQAIRQWRRLPPVISHQHIPLLQVGCIPYPIGLPFDKRIGDANFCFINDRCHFQQQSMPFVIQ